ncbi:MAG: formate dehydrogenase subunit delta [Methylococcaceae bacterium]|jgi:formate dehydrogenase subunit delta
MDNQNLVRMANSIGDFFNAEPDKSVAEAGVADHMRRFWESRMRVAIIAHYQAGGEGMSELVKNAIGRLAREANDLKQAGNG